MLKLKILPKLELNRSKTERILQKHIKNRPKSVKPTNYLEIWNQNIDFFEKNNLNIKKEITNKKTSFHAKNRRDKIEVKKNLQRQKSFEFQKNFFEENIFKNFQNEILGKEKLDLIIQNKEKIEFLKEIKKLEKENEKKYFEDQRENYMKIKFNVEKEKEQKLKTEKKILLVEKKNDLFNLKENKVKIKKILNQKENEEKDWKKLKEIINKFEKIENDKHNLEEITKSYEY